MERGIEDEHISRLDCFHKAWYKIKSPGLCCSRLYPRRIGCSTVHPAGWFKSSSRSIMNLCIGRLPGVFKRRNRYFERQPLKVSKFGKKIEWWSQPSLWAMMACRDFGQSNRENIASLYPCYGPQTKPLSRLDSWQIIYETRKLGHYEITVSNSVIISCRLLTDHGFGPCGTSWVWCRLDNEQGWHESLRNSCYN